MNTKPYVVSEDIEGLLAQWADEKGFTLPQHEQFSCLRLRVRECLEDIFGKGSVDMIPEGILHEGIKALVEDSGLTPVSLDRAYFPSAMTLAINRAVRPDLQDDSIAPRFGSPWLIQQVDTLYEQGLREAVLVDDVIFTGNCMKTAVGLLEKRGIRVPRVVAGVVVGNGRNVLRDHFIDVRWVRFYGEVIDEICERDFFPGVPYCGRAIARMWRDMGVPYLLPFGDPVSWASIPGERAIDFSRDCLDCALDLWCAIEEASGKIVRCCDVPRPLVDTPNDSTRFVDHLKTYKNILRMLDILARQRIVQINGHVPT